ncbi:hypothetical protein HRbin40_01202 [bacterium HR40]|nr:hypothetical protein HRbin40_01202 [bacterium HR40]
MQPAHRSLILALSSAVVACTAGSGPIAENRRLEQAIVSYYRTHAAEKGFTCLAPEIRAITRTEVVEDRPERLVLRVRYHWVDELYGEENGGDFGVALNRCSGFAERNFTFDRTQGMRVVDMSGPKRAP